MHINEEEEIKKEFQLERVILFTDAVFAIILTIMVLDIKLPDDLKSTDPHAMQHAFKELTLRLVAYIITFMLVGRLWMEHLKLFRYLKDYDRNLLILNLSFLLSVTLFPFAISTLFNELPGEQIKKITALPVQNVWGVQIYMTVFLITVFIQSLLAWYLLRNRDTLCIKTDNLENTLEWKVTQKSLFLAPLFLIIVFSLNYFNLPYYAPIIVVALFGYIIGKLKQHYYPENKSRNMVMSHLYNYAKNNRFKRPTKRNTIKTEDQQENSAGAD